MEKSRQGVLKYVFAFIIIGVIIFILNKFNIFKGYGANEMKEYVKSFGVWAPIIYLGILAILPLLLFPDSVMVMAGGMIFGLYKGTLLTLLGSLIGGTVAFYISRNLGQNAVKKIIKKDLVLFREQSEKNGFIIILLLRLVPLFPFKVVSYSAGLSDIKYKDFLLATAIGALPGMIVYTNVGDKSTAVGSTSFYISIGLLVLLTVVSLWLKKKFSTKDIGGIESEEKDVQK